MLLDLNVEPAPGMKSQGFTDSTFRLCLNQYCRHCPAFLITQTLQTSGQVLEQIADIQAQSALVRAFKAMLH